MMRENQLCVYWFNLLEDEIVFGRLLPYMWRECNHRRRQARVQVNLNFVEQASRHSLGLAFETTCRMMMNISGILLVITLDYLFLMESSNQIYNDVQRLIMKIEDLARKAYVYADALVQRDRMISLFRSNHLKSNRREYELILDDKLPIESELHALVVLGYCIKMHYEYFVVCVTVSRSPSPAQAESTSQMIVTPNSKKWWPFKQRKPKRAKPRLDEINADNLISCEWSLNSRLTADTAFHRSMCTKSNLIDEIRRFNQELTNKQLMISLCQSSVRLQELMLFTSARSHQPPVCHLSRWAKLMNRLASDYETRPDESSLSTYQSVPIHSSETLNAPRLYQLFKRKWTHQRQVLLKQALELNQRERQLVLLDFEIKRRQPSINPFAWLNPRTRNLNRFKSQLEKKLGHLFEHRPLPPQCFTVNRILVERIDDTIHDSIGTKMPPSANNVDKYKFLPMWQQQLEKLIECNGLAAGSSILMQALPNESLFWENDSKVLGHMLQQFALQVLIKDTLASNKKWRDLNPMKTLPPKRHLIASLLQMFDRRPPKLSRDCLLSTQSLHLAIRLFWIELIDLSDRVIRSLFPVDWLDQYLLTIESELEETERGNLCYVQLQAIATQPIINFRPFAGWLSDCPLISRKTITRRIVTYEKSINQI